MLEWKVKKPAKSPKLGVDYKNPLHTGENDSPQDVRVANYWNYGFAMCKENNLPLPNGIRYTPERFSDGNDAKGPAETFAIWVPHSDGMVEFSGDAVICLNPYFAWDDLGEWTKRNHAEGELATSDIIHVLCREIGHIHYLKTNKRSYTRYAQHKNGDPFEAYEAALTLSKRAAQSPLQFVCEAFAFQFIEGPLPEEVLEQYNRIIQFQL